MSAKQDRTRARTATDLEYKYNFGKTFADVYGLVSDAQKAAEEAKKAVDELDATLTHEEIFNRLTNYGEVQGIYRGDDGDVYINASYIKSGKIAAEYIDATNLKVDAANITGSLTIGQLPDGVAQSGEIPTKISSLINDVGFQDESGVTTIVGGLITTDYIEALGISVAAANITGILRADQVALTGAITFEDLSDDVNNTLNGISNLAINASNTANSASNKVNAWTYSGTTYIDGTKILTGTVTASSLYGGSIGLLNALGASAGSMTLGSATSGSYAVQLTSNAAMRITAASGDMWLQSSNLSSPYLWIRGSITNGSLNSGGHFYPGENETYNLGRSDMKWDGVYSMTSSATTSDRNEKNSIIDIPEEYVTLFMGLRPRMYKYNKGTSGRYHIGYIAQEVEEAMKAAGISSKDLAALIIDYDADGNKIYMLRYEEFIALHTLMIQRLMK